MNADQVKAYVNTQVTALADRRIKPLIQSVNGELETQRVNNARKSAIDAENAESDKRIAVLQQEIGKAQAEVNDLAVKLAEATTVAVNTGAGTQAAL
jgi:hypothetical protein